MEILDVISKNKAGLRTVVSDMGGKVVAGARLINIVDGGGGTCTLAHTGRGKVSTGYVSPGSCRSERIFGRRLLGTISTCRPSLVILTNCLIMVPPRVVGGCGGQVVGVRPSLVPSFYKANCCKLGIRRTTLTHNIGMINTAMRFMSRKASANPVVLRGTMRIRGKSAPRMLRHEIVRRTR